jgi:hypothetical protein
MKKIWYINNSFKSAPPEFIMLVKTDNSGTSGSNEFTIPTFGTGYNYTVQTSEQTLTNQTGSVTLTWVVAGTYEVKISGVFPRIFFNNTGDRLKVLEVQNWGIINWTSFNSAFRGCSNMVLTAIDVPVLSSVINIQNIFRDCTVLTDTNGSLSHWNVSSVTTFVSAFRNISIFNSQLSGWNVSSGSSLLSMFTSSSINQNLSSWILRTSGVDCRELFRSSSMSSANYTDTLVGWVNNAVANGNLPVNVTFANHSGNTFDRARSGGANFANAGAARDYMINTLGWTITSDTVIN